MKLLMVVPDFAMEPTGLAYISAVLKKEGHELDCVWQRETPDLRAVIERGRYDFVLTGALSVHYRQIKAIVDAAKAAGARVIVGGGLVSVMPELVGDSLGIDFSVIGEGEATVVDLLQHLSRGEDPALVAGIAYLKDGKTVVTVERKAIRELDTLPLPDWSALHLEHHLDRAKPSQGYLHDPFDHPRLYPLIASRSCPYACTFCDHPLGRVYRQRSLDSVFEELRVMVPKYGINIVSIYDELFSVKKARVLEWCERFDAFRRSMGREMVWNAQMRCDQVDEEMLAAMKASGCHLISYGFESYSEPVLRSMQKKGGLDAIDRAIHWTYKHKIGIQGNFIFGDPVETYHTAQETLAYWREHAFSGINLFFIIPAPDSGIYRHCVKKGLVGDPIDFIQNRLYDLVNFSSMSDAEFDRLKFDIAAAKVGHFPRSVASGIGDDWVRADCPHCRTTVEYRNFDYRNFAFAAPPLVKPSRLWFSLNVQCRSCRGRFYVMSRLNWLWLKTLAAVYNRALYGIFTRARRFFRKASADSVAPRPWLKVATAPRPAPKEETPV